MINSPIRILIVEDDEGDALLIREYLHESGQTFIMDQADRLSTALQKLEEKDFDVILLDLSLPDSQGLETLTMLNSQTNVPIIILTGWNNEMTGVKAVSRGAQDYLVKGNVEMPVLVRSIRYAMERKKTEIELLEKNRELTEFAHVVSHDLKAPIGNIKTYIGLIWQNPELVDDPNELYSQLDDECNRMISFVDNLLQLARAGKVIQKKQAVDPGRILENAVRTRADGTIPIKFSIEEKIPLIQADSDRLEQVFVNLVQNSIKYRDSSKKQVEINLSCEIMEDEFHFIYRDNGIGLNPAYREKIFQAGFALNRDKGTGFGLSIVRKIIEAHEGKIRVKDCGEGEGIAFEIILPAVPPT